MNPSPPLRMKVLLQVVFLLKLTSNVWLQEDRIAVKDLQCVNDYLCTIKCSLNITASENVSVINTSYWLTFTETFEQLEYSCLLTRATEGYFCSIKTSDAPPDDISSDTFTDLDVYEISFCWSSDNGSKKCELLDEEYEPISNITPNAPCCLTVSHNSSQHHFIWRSTYEEYSDYTVLAESLKYELHLYKRGEKNRAIILNTDTTNLSVDDEKFVANTEYAARVRSSPDMVYFKGQWSAWSSEVTWKTHQTTDGLSANAFTFDLCVGLIASLFAIVLVILLLSYSRIKRWRQSTFIPTPAPYFHSLYRDYQGDFKSWVVTQEKAVDVLKAEETVQIDTLVKVVLDDKRPPIFQQQLEDRSYSNIPDWKCNADLSDPCSVKTLPVWSDPGSPAQDSGCWLCSDTSLEKEPPWYCNEYCTLSCIQQSGCITAEHHGNPAYHRLST